MCQAGGREGKEIKMITEKENKGRKEGREIKVVNEKEEKKEGREYKKEREFQITVLTIFIQVKVIIGMFI